MIPVPSQVLDQLAACFDTAAENLTYLGGGREDSDGIAYLYPSGGAQRVLKILPVADSSGPAGGLARLHERLKFTYFLRQHDVDIVYPLPLPDGSLVATAQADGQTFAAYAMEKVGGHKPGKDDFCGQLFRAWGQTVGRLHRVTQLYPTWQHSLAEDEQPLLGWEEELQGFYDMTGDPAIQARWEGMRARLSALPVTRDAFGFIHNDPHNENLMLNAGRLTLLDFDVANYHWFVTDISIAMQALLFNTTGGMERPVRNAAPLRHFIDQFMRGYETENHLDPAWLGQLDLFISYRRLLLFTVMQGWLATQPQTRAAWWKMIVEEPPILNV